MFVRYIVLILYFFLIYFTASKESGKYETNSYNHLEFIKELNVPASRSIGSNINKILDFLQKVKFNSSYIGLDVDKHIQKYGYPSEVHKVITPDGYILTMHRIPHGKEVEQIKVTRPVVFLQVGLMCSSACFVDFGPEKSLGFLLADRGFDVWLGNTRGTTFSRNNIAIDPDEGPDFWKYNLNDLGTYDVPTMIDYILKQTGQEKLHYVGHSQGTTAFFIMASEKPEYNEKIKAMIGLAPVAYMSHVEAKFKTLAALEKTIAITLKLLKIYEVLPRSKVMEDVATKYCGEANFDERKCKSLLEVIIAYDPAEFDLKWIPLISTHFPGGASVEQVLHYFQICNSGKFQKYDYGKIKNNKIYGQSTPPIYNLKKVTAPVALLWGQEDTLASPEDIKRLNSELPNVVEYYRIDYDAFNHGSFLWGHHIIPHCYSKVFELLDKYD